MDIDWVTFAAQIANFLVLVWLLKRFLYGPIVRAMDAREQQFVDRSAELEQARREAEQREAEYRERLSELDRTKESLMETAAQEVEAWRQQHLAAAREEIEDSRREWYRGLEREKDSLLHELQRRVGREVFRASRHVLKQLCDVSLEQQVIVRFEQHLQQLDADRRAEIAQAIVNSHHRVMVATAFPLDSRQQQTVTRQLHEYVAEGIAVDFSVHPELICGIEVRAAGYKIAWSAGELLEEIETSFAAALDGTS